MPQTAAQPGPGWGRALGWAAFLACSWTWCIGMFLPILLLRDFGMWGFLVFAAPNILGAAGMGWVLWRDGASERMVAAHRPAMVWFSCATLGFHVFWLAWLAGAASDWIIAPEWAIALGATMGLAVGAGGGLAAWGRPARWATLAAPITLGLSLVAMATLLGADGVRIAPLGSEVATTQAPDALLWLAPVVVFGFALCPYLDLTFHRARQALPAAKAKLAFSLGFGVMFCAMIVLTVLYSGWLVGPVSGSAPVAAAPVIVALALSAHIVAQATFTVLAHTSALTPPRNSNQPDQRRRPSTLLLLWTVLIGPAAAVLALSLEGGLWGLSVGELLYRSFLGLYGLAFPAYVWLVVIPTGREQSAGISRSSLHRQKLLVWAGAIILASPCFGAGFLARESLWLIPGMAIVLGARLIVRRLSGGSRTRPASE